MSKTTTAMIEVVRSRIGGRADNKLGNLNINDVILTSLNDAVIEIARDSDIRTLSRICEIDLTADESTYAFPTMDTEDSAIRIKDILIVQYIDDDYEYTMKELVKSNALELNQNITSTRPEFYSIHGENLIISPTPSQADSLRLYVTIYPVLMTMDQNHPYGREYNDVIEAYATYDVFLTLQQTEDAAAWKSVFDRKYRQMRMAEKLKIGLKQSANPNANGMDGRIDSPFNPFLRSI